MAGPRRLGGRLGLVGAGQAEVTSQTASGSRGSRSTRLPHPAVQGHSKALRAHSRHGAGAARRRRSRRRSDGPAGFAIPPCCGPAPPTPARLGGGGRGSAGPRLRPPLLVAGLGLSARSGIRRRWRRAPFTHVVGYRTPPATFAGEVDTLLDPATYGSRWVSLTRRPAGRLSRRRRRPGTTVSVLSGANPAGRIGCQLSIR